jgi:GNAT superfamily N-acetyltransferase
LDRKIRRCSEEEFDAIFEIVNDGSQAYRGVIPADRFTEPYMPQEELQRQVGEGVTFWGYADGGPLLGVMGIQKVADVTLIRHAYVRSGYQKRGIGGALLTHLRALTIDPILIGTWRDASWAIRFYEKHGFALVTDEEKDRLLRTYWKVPQRQIETSVVLADKGWKNGQISGAWRDRPIS